MPATPGPGDQLTAILAGASAAILSLQNGMSRMIRPIWIMAPTIARFIATARDQVGGFYFKDEMERGMFEGYPVRLTQQIPTNLVMTTYTKASEIYFVDMADFVIADTYNVDRRCVGCRGLQRRDRHGVVVPARPVVVPRDRRARLQHATPSVARGAADAGLGLLRRFLGLPGAPYSTQPLNPTWSQAAAIRPARRPARTPRRRSPIHTNQEDTMPVEGRDDEVVPVTFIKVTASYFAGECASFLPEKAQALIDERASPLAGDPATSPPVNLTVPHVGQDGDILSCTMGNWTGEPTAYAYQWQRDGTEDVGDGTDAYTVTADDVGHTDRPASSPRRTTSVRQRRRHRTASWSPGRPRVSDLVPGTLVEMRMIRRYSHYMVGERIAVPMHASAGTRSETTGPAASADGAEPSRRRRSTLPTPRCRNVNRRRWCASNVYAALRVITPPASRTDHASIWRGSIAGSTRTMTTTWSRCI